MNESQEKVENFFQQFERRSFKKGEIIIHPEESLGPFYIKQGYIKEYGISLQGAEITIHIFTPGSFFPMTWVMCDIPNRYYYEAVTDVDCYVAPKKQLVSFLKENPEIMFVLSQRLLQGLDKLTSRIEHMAYGSAAKRMSSILLYLARHFGEYKENKVFIKQKFTHRDIGALAGITRETTSREWEKLVERQLVGEVGQMIVLYDVDVLKEELL